MKKQFNYVGRRLPRWDALEKVTGAARFATDVRREGMLHAAVVRSPHHHARILGLDTSEAERMPGVAGVFTARDIPGMNRRSPAHEGWVVLAEEDVQYLGEPVAVVAAEDCETALEAAARVHVDYQPLPPVFDPLEALKEGAPSLGRKGNIDYIRKLVKGDVKEGFSQAEVILEGSFTTPFQEHAYMEPDSALSYFDDEGRLMTEACTQLVDNTHEAIASLLGLPPEKVVVLPPYIGGGFGGKYVETCWLLAALTCFKLKRPVRLSYTKEEVLLYTRKRQPLVMRYRLGAKRDGTLVALEAELIANAGSRPTGTPPTNDFPLAVVHATGPYVIPHIRVKGTAVATNAPRGCAFRGLGGIGVHFAMETLMDELAQRLGVDPIELRLKNAFELGSRTATGHLLEESVGLKETLEAARRPYAEALRRARGSGRAAGREERPWIRRGVGLASMYRLMNLRVTETPLELLDDGRIRVVCSVPEIGQGAFTVLAQIVAEELGVPPERLVMEAGPKASAGASAGTTSGGNSLILAARRLGQALVKEAATILEAKEEEVRLEEGYAFSTAFPQERLSLERLAASFKEKGLPLCYQGSWKPAYGRNIDPETGQGTPGQLYGFATQVAEVEVDTETGRVRVLQVFTAQDAGRVINPLTMEGQMEGGIAQGLGFAVLENFRLGETRTLTEYQIPSVEDVPRVQSVFIEPETPTGPFDAKGGGEISNVATPAAILNAVASALGVRIYDLPASPERVLAVLGRASPVA